MIKAIKFLSVSFVIFSLAIASFADTIVEPIAIDSVVTLTQDSTIVLPKESSIWKEVFSFNNIIIVLVGLYEILIRIYPTAKDYSMLSTIYKILNFIVPNKKKEGGTHS